MPDPNPLPTSDMTREEIARVEVGHTAIDPRLALLLTVGFLAALLAVLLVETLAGGDPAATSPWRRLFAMPSAVIAGPGSQDLGGGWHAWNRAMSANRTALAEIAAFENALDESSVLGRALRPPAQRLLSGALGAGNERVYLGRDGWLFYRTDVDYVTGPPFLDERQLRRRAASADEWTAVPAPDPRPAIRQFHRQLADRGILLVLMPTPVKPAVHPEKLTPRLEEPREPLHNGSFQPLLEELRREGITVFDPSPPLAAARRPSAPQYLATDTHWRPEGMELAAERLAAFIREHVELPAAAAPGYRFEEREVSNTGDTTVMLDLAEGQTRYAAEAVLIRRVLQADGTPWRSDPEADVLVLGDSFSNIYALASLGWGDSAGLVEHVSAGLGRPVDRFVQNDAGAYATREMLQRADSARLSRKRVVIWQFAERELASGDWRLIDLP